MSLQDTLNRHLFLSVSVGHFIGLVLGGLVALGVMVLMGQNLIGWTLAALLAFLVIHLFHARPRQKVVMAVIASVVMVAVGGAVVNPGFVDSMKNGSISDNDNFSSIGMEMEGGSLVIHVDCRAPGGEGTIVPAFSQARISMIIFGGIYADSNGLSSYEEFTGGRIVLPDWNTDELHQIGLAFCTKTTDGGNTVLTPIKSTGLVFDDAKVFTGDASSICWAGAGYGTLFFAAIFLFLTLAGWFFRGRMQKTREKLEEQGRLYPQGYGRCSKCNAIILPGEVECRKCGAYIDRPDSMKRRKADYFRCTNCGSEVPEDADACPKCGAVFGGEETKIVHSDGSSEDAFECPDCGSMVPAGPPSGVCICPRCGKRFQR